MIAHQPFDGLGIGLVQSQTRCHAARDLRAQDRVILGPALADIVQKQRKIDHLAVHTFAQDA